jgi:hypothetical protein
VIKIFPKLLDIERAFGGIRRGQGQNDSKEVQGSGRENGRGRKVRRRRKMRASGLIVVMIAKGLERRRMRGGSFFLLHAAVRVSKYEGKTEMWV